MSDLTPPHGIVRPFMPRRRRREPVWPSVLVLLLVLLAVSLVGAHRDDLRRECVERGGVPSDAVAFGVRCTEVQR